MKNPVFNFEVYDIKSHFQYKLKSFRKMKKSLDFVFNMMESLGHYKKLTSLENVDFNTIQKEGKNYDWSVIEYKNVKLLIRTYQRHLTIFVKVEQDDKVYPTTDYGAFTFYTNLEHRSVSDDDHDRMSEEMWNNKFLHLNGVAKNLFEVLQKEGGTHWLSNSASFKVPKFIDVKVAFSNEMIHSYDKIIFAFEELSSLNHTLFAENTMLEKLKEGAIKIGDKIGRDKVIEVCTKFPEQYSDPYYHGVGVRVNDGDRDKMIDVYSLTRYYYEYIFTE